MAKNRTSLSTLSLGILFSLLAVSLVTIDLAKSGARAEAASANPGVSSTGYIYSQNYDWNGIQRYNLATGETSQIDMTDSSCQDKDKEQIYDIAVDVTGHQIIWSNASYSWGPWGSRQRRTEINSINLMTGICSNLVKEEFPVIAGGDFHQFQGVALDEANRRLFYVDQGGASQANNLNESLHYLDLVSLADHVIRLDNQSPDMTLGYATDIFLDGDYAYLSGRQYVAVNSAGEGDSIFKVQITDGGTISNQATPDEIFHWDPSNGSSPNIYQIDFQGGKIFFASMDYGIFSFDISSAPSDSPNQIIEYSIYPDSTGSYSWTGFALGQAGELFSMDYADGAEGWGPGNQPIWWFSKWGASSQPPAALSGELGGQSYWSLPVYDSREFPSIPKVTNVSITGTSATVNIRRPIDRDVDGSYNLVATPVSGGSTISARCNDDSTGTCTLDGLVAGLAYNFKINQSWRNASGDVIISSAYSTDFLYNANLPTINHFDVFENTVNRFTYRSGHESITAENVDESAAEWVSNNLDEDFRNLAGAEEFVTFSWFLCETPVTQAEVSHISFDDLSRNNCVDGEYSTLYSYADQSEVGKFSTLGVHAKNAQGDTYTMQSRTAANANRIIFGSTIQDSGGLVEGGSLQSKLDDVLSPSYNPPPVDSILESVSGFRTRTGQQLTQQWYRCTSPLPVQAQFGSTDYPLSNQIPAGCVNLNQTQDTYQITEQDLGKYIMSAITLDEEVTQVSQRFIPASLVAEKSAKKIFTGFLFEKGTLTATTKKLIKNWLSSKTGYTKVNCVGYTGFNYNNRSETFLKKLALERATNACSYIHFINPSIHIVSKKAILDTAMSSKTRRVLVTIKN